MTTGDGNGWVVCGLGHRHWGRFGAAGLLVRAERRVLLQLRVAWSHHGDTWGVPGGARDSTESAVAAALREAAEEVGLDGSAIEVAGESVDDHGGWSYTTVLATAGREPPVHAASPESAAVRWVSGAAVSDLPLHPGFAASWAALREAPAGLTLVVDVANVMGSRPDGWWRDRAGAARTLHGQVEAAAVRGLVAVPGGAALDRWYPRVVSVVEGAARPAAELAGVVAAAGSGDDAIVAAATEARTTDPDRLVVVVTADRELRARCVATGAEVAGPRWLLGQLPTSS